MSYSRFIAGLHQAGVEVDRKILADLAVRDAAAFGTLVSVARQALGEADDAADRRETRLEPVAAAAAADDEAEADESAESVAVGETAS